jgi:hypothetical protein
VLSLGKVRELLADSDSALEVRELEDLRDQLYRLAGQVVRAARHGTAGHPQLWDRIPPDLLDEVEERAAIMEFDGGLPRKVAELRAIDLVRAKMTGGRR